MTTAKLNDRHLVILRHAAQRSNHRVLPLGAGLMVEDGAVMKAIKSLIRRGLVAEIAATRRDPEWRRGADGDRLALVLTPAGLTTIGVGQEKGPNEDKVPTGNAAAGSASAANKDDRHDRKAGVRSDSKGQTIKLLLQRKSGATLSDLMETSGWQAHSVRGFISGTLKKKLGLPIASEKTDAGERSYRIVAR